MGEITLCHGCQDDNGYDLIPKDIELNEILINRDTCEITIETIKDNLSGL